MSFLRAAFPALFPQSLYISMLFICLCVYILNKILCNVAEVAINRRDSYTVCGIERRFGMLALLVVPPAFFIVSNDLPSGLFCDFHGMFHFVSRDRQGIGPCRVNVQKLETMTPPSNSINCPLSRMKSRIASEISSSLSSALSKNGNPSLAIALLLVRFKLSIASSESRK